MYIYGYLFFIYYLCNVYLLHTWPLSSRADNHHYNTPLFCHNSQGFHKSCCSFENNSLHKTLLNTLERKKIQGRKNTVVWNMKHYGTLVVLSLMVLTKTPTKYETIVTEYLRNETIVIYWTFWKIVGTIEKKEDVKYWQEGRYIFHF